MKLINGAPGDQVAADDRGLMYGDGVFRTLRLKQGRPQHWARHYQKLQSDCQALRIQCPAEELFRADIGRLAAQMPDAVLKLMVTRGAAVRGYAVNPALPVTRIASVSAVPSWPAAWFEAGVRVHVCRLRLGDQPALAGVKHLNRLENVLARMEWDDPAIAEGLLLDQRGHVIEGTMSNLFMRCGEMLYTPALDTCGVAGVTRDRVLALAGALGLKARVEPIAFDRLGTADELIQTNSVMGAWSIREVAGRDYGPPAVAPALRRLLEQDE